MDIFWWVFLENYQNNPKIQKKLLERASTSYVALLMMEIDLRYRDKCFQVYPSLLAETIFACYKVCFPASIKQMPIDAEAAGKSAADSQNSPFDLGNHTESNSGQRMKELVNLDGFKNSIANICQLWLSGLPVPPRRYEQWRSKLVQQEKITFVDPTLTANSSTAATTTNALPSIPATTHNSPTNGKKSSPIDNAAPLSSNPPTFTRNKRKDPHELLEQMYRHTYDSLPE